MRRVITRFSTEVKPHDIVTDLVTDVDLSSAAGAMLFISPDLDLEAINTLLHAALGNVSYIGCTVLAAHAKDKKHTNQRDETAVIVYFTDTAPLAAGHLAEIGDETKQYFAFSCGDSELSSLLDRFSCFGGLAADDWTFDACAIFHNGKVFPAGTVALEFPPEADFMVDAISGWEPVEHGWTGTVTKAVGNEVFSISGMPAIEFYESIVHHTELFGAHPVKLESSDVLRAVLSVDHDAGSISFSYNIAEGEKIRITSAKRQDVLNSTENLMRRNRSAMQDKQFTLAVSCAARNQILANLAHKEFELLSTCSKHGVAIYLYGEFIPKRGYSVMENQHIVIGAIN